MRRKRTCSGNSAKGGNLYKETLDYVIEKTRYVEMGRLAGLPTLQEFWESGRHSKEVEGLLVREAQCSHQITRSCDDLLEFAGSRLSTGGKMKDSKLFVDCKTFELWEIRQTLLDIS